MSDGPSNLHVLIINGVKKILTDRDIADMKNDPGDWGLTLDEEKQLEDSINMEE